MKELIPTYYSEYGRYISRFRAIPLIDDCLKPAERRVLLSLYEMACTKPTKSHEIDGYVVGRYHPHGSAYPVLVNLVRSGFASSQHGSWGGPGLKEDPNAAASRYTETCLEKWVEKLAFEFIDYVPWEMYELNEEPRYLPTPIPLGIIGNGVVTGLSFYKTLIPQYRKEDLTKRLLWLLKNRSKVDLNKIDWDKEMDPKKYGPQIVPNKTDCTIREASPNALYSLLYRGYGDLYFVPKGNITEIPLNKGSRSKVKTKVIVIEGRAPNHSLTKLLKDFDAGKLPIQNLVDTSEGQDFRVIVEPKKGIDLQELSETLWQQYCIKKLNFMVYTCDNAGNVATTPIDDLLLRSFKNWTQAYWKKLSSDIENISKRFLNNEIYKIVRDLLSNKKILDFETLWNYFPKNKKLKVPVLTDTSILKEERELTKELVLAAYTNSPIKKLVEYHDQENQIVEDLRILKETIENFNGICIDRLKDIK